MAPVPMSALTLAELRASLLASQDRQRYFDAAESPQWTLEREARLANDKFMANLRAEIDARYEAATTGIGSWLSAALEDPAVCDAMKTDILAWMEATHEADLCPCGEDSPEGCAWRPSRHCPGVPA